MKKVSNLLYTKFIEYRNMTKLYLIITLILLSLSQSIVADDTTPYYWKRLNHKYDSVGIRLEQALFEDMEYNECRSLVALSDSIADRSNDPQIKARALYWKAWFESKTKAESAMDNAKKAIAMTDSAKYPYDIARLKYIIGYINYYRGQWSEAYITMMNLEHFFEKQKDSFWQARTNVVTGVILQNLGQYTEAIHNFRTADSLFVKVNANTCRIKNKINISNNLYLLDNKTEALSILKSLVKEPIVTADTLYLVNVLISISKVSDRKDIEASYKAYHLIKQMKYRELYSLSELTVAEDMAAHNKIDSALYYYRMAWKSAQFNHNVYDKPTILRGISDAFIRLNQPDSAYFYMNLANIYQDSLLNHNKIIELNKLESISMMKLYEADLKIAKERMAIQQKTTILIIVVIVTLFGMILYILLLSRRKARMSVQLKDAQNRELILQNKQQSIEIESKNRELSSNTLLIAQKNAKLKELYDQIEQQQSNDGNNIQLNDELISNIKSQFSEDDEWKYFIIKFEKMYPDFLLRLKKSYPALSETDLRLCAYLRIGLTSKEIAQIISVQPETVNTSRYRIRKKMNLSPGQSLENALRLI